jgi:hypothetical protein
MHATGISSGGGALAQDARAKTSEKRIADRRKAANASRERRVDRAGCDFILELSDFLAKR